MVDHDDYDDDGWCDCCDDDNGDHQLDDESWICNACLIDRYKDLLKKQVSEPGPATRVVIEQVQTSLANEYTHVPTGRIVVDLTPDEWRDFLDEQGVD